ncbi:MAG: hypothetical protein M3R36_12375 [Bacteroidota bacterium]|nr:hypothetical protein [Bacteroidota bacterium]
MINNKVVDILKTFTGEDIKRFRDYLNSPFFNRSEKLARFYEAIMAFYPAFNSKFFNEEKLLKKISPDLAFNKSTVLNLFSDLFEAAENYLMYINFQKKEIESKDYLRDELFKRKLNRSLEISLSKHNAVLKGVKNFNSDYFINMFKLSTDLINYNIINKNKSKGSSIEWHVAMQAERGKYITYFFVKEMIRAYDNLLTMDKTFRIEREKNFVFKLFNIVEFEKLLKLVVSDSGNDEHSKIFELYLALFLTFSKFDNEKYYYNYKKLYLRNLKYFSIDEIRFHNGRLLRYCMLKSSNKTISDKFDKERFDIYNFLLDNGYYKSSVSDYIPVELYRPILLLSLKLKKYKWSFEFIKKYRMKIHPDRRENMYHFSCAEYYFSRGRYAEAMKSFHKVKLNHFMLKVDLKDLMLMTYYELGLYENALSLIDTYRHFLSNDTTLSITEKKKCKNFINIIKLMIKYRTSESFSTKYLIENELKNELPYKDWLEEKILEMDAIYNKSA